MIPFHIHLTKLRKEYHVVDGETRHIFVIESDELEDLRIDMTDIIEQFGDFLRDEIARPAYKVVDRPKNPSVLRKGSSKAGEGLK